MSGSSFNPKKGPGAPRSKAKGKPYKFAHTAGSQKGLGDYYGTGVRAKVGRVREGLGMEDIPPSKLKKPPKSLA